MEKEVRLMRQLDIIPMYALDIPITVIGAGAVGSHVVKALAQMGFDDITVFDDDVVSEENLNSQGYPVDALTEPKVMALANIVEAYTGEKGILDVRPERYDGGVFEGIVISAVDNMATRKLIWENHAGKALKTLAIIDPRMGAEFALLYVMNPMKPTDQITYTKTLHTDEEGVPEPCTAKATIYTAMLLAGLVCKAVKDVAMGLNYTRSVVWNICANDCEINKSNEVSMAHP